LNIESLSSFTDDRGELIPIEFSKLPFVPVRCFFVSASDVNVIRGNHAHYKTQQWIYCVKGMIEVNLFDGKYTTIKTIKKGEAILVPALIWDSQKYLTDDTLLLVFCSTPYHRGDYIEDKDAFIKITNP
jgi:dTDP-4-dehydrorhamnose 3,5-epimerase-like enzyme